MTNILYLLRLEWLKVKNYMPFLVLSAMYIMLLPLFMAVGKSINLPKELGGTDVYYMFPNIWQSLAYVGNWLAYFIMGFIAVLTVTNEFSNRTLRQNIISGISRTDFFLSKTYFLVGIALIGTLYYAIVALLYGFFNTETIYASRMMENIDMIPRYFLMCLSFMSFGLMLGVLLRRTGIALFLYFAYIMFIERIIRYLILGKIFGGTAALYGPMSATNDLTPFPIPKMIKGMAEGSNIRIFLTPTESMITASLFMVLFFFIAYYQLKTRDL